MCGLILGLEGLMSGELLKDKNNKKSVINLQTGS